MPGGASRAAVSPAAVLDVVTHHRLRVIGSVRTVYSPMIVHVHYLVLLSTYCV